MQGMRDPLPEPLSASRPNRPERRPRGALARILGDTPLRTAVKLAVASVLVGWVMNLFGWRPADLFFALEEALRDLWRLGFSAFDSFFAYFLLGAAVVLPVFVVLRLLSARR